MGAPDGFAVSVGVTKTELVTAASIHTTFQSRMLRLFCMEQPLLCLVLAVCYAQQAYQHSKLMPLVLLAV